MTNDLLWAVVFLQLIMGASDTLFHHEFSERLAWQPSAQNELKLHSARNFIYAGLFLGFAWLFPQGAFAIVALSFIFIEVLITLWDFVEEDLSRKLPATERVLHTLLALNYGAILALLVPILWEACFLPTMLVPVVYGAGPYYAGSWLLTFAAVGVFFFGIRDLLASKRLSHLKRGAVDELAANLKGHRHILITGATGFIGSRLTKALLANGHAITVLSRDPRKAYELGTPLKVISSLDEIRDEAAVDCVVNLAGEPLANGIWTRAKRARIVGSRRDMIGAIEGLCKRLYVPPKTIVTASAIGWYGLRGDEPLTEESASKPCFTHDVCHHVEEGADRLKAFGCRVVKLRIGLVLDTQGGMLANLLVPFEYGLGGPIGDGRHWMSWIDLDDCVRLIVHALQAKDLEGAVNAVAPTPVRNRDFAKAIGHALHRPSLFALNQGVLKFALGDFAKELLLAGQRVVPQKALASGFVFHAATIDQALEASLPFHLDKQSHLSEKQSQSNLAHKNIICREK